MTTTLPLDLPPLVAVAEEMAREAHDAQVAAIKARHRGSYAQSLIDALPPMWVDVDAHARLLADLRRPLSRAFWREWLAQYHGKVTASTPWWTYEPPSPTPRDRDGAPYREDWPARWVLLTAEGDDLTFVDVDPELEEGDDPWYPERWIVVPGMATKDPAAALRLAVMTAAGRDPAKDDR